MLEVLVKKAPTIRFTQDNQTPIAEIEVEFDSLRADDPPCALKVVGWGKLAEELQNSVQVNSKLVIEGRLRMNTVPRQDGTKEKQAELTASRIHHITPIEDNKTIKGQINSSDNKEDDNSNKNPDNSEWNSSPLVPEVDEIPF